MFTCDAIGNRGCTNPSCDLNTDCQECTITPTAGTMASSPSTAPSTLNMAGTLHLTQHWMYSNKYWNGSNIFIHRLNLSLF